MTRSLLSIAQLSPQDSRALLSRTLQISRDLKKPGVSLSGRTIALLFYENSTRTRISFESAIRAEGGSALSLAIANSSVQKGETLEDTVRNLSALGASGFVIRHPVAGAAAHLSATVINAGDGMHEHPTQALLDSATLLNYWGLDPNTSELPLSGRRILVLGDIRHSRVARSNFELLQRLGAEVLASGPGPLLPGIHERGAYPGVKWLEFPDPVLCEVDAVMVLRLQTERARSGFIPSTSEYRHFWGLTEARARRLRSDAVILHPGPANPGIEIDADVMTEPRSRILEQVSMGIAARRAALAWAFSSRGPDGGMA